MVDALKEKLADAQHSIWAHWMKYMFSCGVYNPDGTWTMPKEKVERWQRQMETSYGQLSDKEKESDRHQANKIIALLVDRKDVTIS